jgi:hypothetical protein
MAPSANESRTSDNCEFCFCTRRKLSESLPDLQCYFRCYGCEDFSEFLVTGFLDERPRCYARSISSIFSKGGLWGRTRKHRSSVASGTKRARKPVELNCERLNSIVY